ncbi:hypothetical protein GCM10009755_14570 [Brevibacterium samyangense]|uniref:Cell division protein FtsQ n=1 Tax=Brevibacterium samyangense TaxID=366888 RepID=A0ABP5EU92_9MICO
MRGTEEAPASLSERLRARRMRRIRTWSLAIGGAVVVLATAAVLWFSPVLAVRSVEVTGSEYVDGSALADSLTETYAGTPLPQVPRGEVSEAVLAAHHQIAEAEVSWGGPRTLVVTLTDRVPVLALHAGDSWTRYDAEGVAIDTAERAPEGIAVVELAPDGEGAEGTEDSAEVVAQSLALLRAIPDTEREQVRSVRVRSATDLQVVLGIPGDAGRDGSPEAGEESADTREVTIDFGTAEDIERKFEIARILVGEGATSIDVSVPDAPVVRDTPED